MHFFAKKALHFILHIYIGEVYFNDQEIPAGTRRQNNVVTTSFQLFDVITTSMQRRSNVMRLLRYGEFHIMVQQNTGATVMR